MEQLFLFIKSKSAQNRFLTFLNLQPTVDEPTITCKTTCITAQSRLVCGAWWREKKITRAADWLNNNNEEKKASL